MTTIFPIKLLIIAIVVSLLIMMLSHGRRLLGAGLVAIGALMLAAVLIVMAIVLPSKRFSYAPRVIPAVESYVEFTELDRSAPHQDRAQRAEVARRQAMAAARRHAAAVERGLQHLDGGNALRASRVPQTLPRDASLSIQTTAADGEIGAGENLTLLQQAAEDELIIGPDPPAIAPVAEALPADDVEPSSESSAVDTAQTTAVETPTTDSNSTATSSGSQAHVAGETPAWVHQPPAEVDGFPALLLVSDPYEDRFACNKDLEQRTAAAIELAARERCRQRGLSEGLPIKVTYDEIRVVSRERFYQTRVTSVGEMLQAYQLTVLNDEFSKKLDQRIEEAVVHRRLAATGVCSAGVLLVVSALFGTFRFVSRKVPDPIAA